MSIGEVDTINLLSDKLNNLFDESQDYYESFLDANNMYKKGKLTDKEFFQKLGDYVVAYSALEFLSIKVIFELTRDDSLEINVEILDTNGNVIKKESKLKSEASK